MDKTDKLSDLESEMKEFFELVVNFHKSLKYYGNKSEIIPIHKFKLKRIEKIIVNMKIDMDEPFQLLSLNEMNETIISLQEKFTNLILDLSSIVNIPMEEIKLSEKNGTVKINVLQTFEKILRKVKTD